MRTGPQDGLRGIGCAIRHRSYGSRCVVHRWREGDSAHLTMVYCKLVAGSERADVQKCTGRCAMK